MEMTEQLDGVPTKLEVRSQLKRILSSAQFKTAALQRNLLRLIVETSLSGTPIRELQIMTELYGGVTESHKVRQNVKFVRDKLAEFYSFAGAFDPVEIEIRPGQYGAAYSYRYDQRVGHLFREGIHHQSRFSDQALVESSKCLSLALELAPSHLPSLIELVQTKLLLALHYGLLNPCCNWSQGVLAEVNSLLVRLASHDQAPKWQVSIFSGTAALLAHSFEEARTAFEAALIASPEQAGTCLWLVLYRATMGQMQQAREIVDYHLENGTPSAGIYLIASAVYYALRKYREVDDLCGRATTLFNQTMDITDLLWGLASLGECKPSDAYLCFASIRPFAPDEEERRLKSGEPVNPRVGGLKYLSLKRWQEEHLAKGGIANQLMWVVRLDYVRGDLESEGKRLQINEEKRLEDFRLHPSPKPIQDVFSFMAQKRNGRALASLRRSWRAREIWTLWWNVLPVFDALRQHPRFNELLPAKGPRKGVWVLRDKRL